MDVYKIKKEDCNQNQDSMPIDSYVLLEPICKVEESQNSSNCNNEYMVSLEGIVTAGTRQSSEKTMFPTQENKNSKQFECLKCNRKYKNKQILSSHIRMKHNVPCVASNAKMPCLENNCDFRGIRITNLISHLVCVHQKKFDCEKVTFCLHEDFWNWKKQAEERCKSSYSSITAPKKLASGDQKLFLRCIRSGYTSSKNSIKINAICTSFIDATLLQDGSAVVHFCKTHYGHDEDVSYIRMNDRERAMIKDLILEGLTASAIISIMKSKLPVYRHHLLKYANIRNISMKQKLFLARSKTVSSQSKSIIENEESDQSVKSWDFALDLKVDNEVEIEAAHILESELTVPSTSTQKRDPEMIAREGNHAIKQLKAEVADKALKIARYASGLVSEASLSTLNKRLDSMLEDIEQAERIEVIPANMESTENCKQGSCTFEDIVGNSVFLVCSDGDVHELPDGGTA